MGFKFNPLTGQFDMTGGGGGIGIGTPITSANEHRILLTDGTSPDPLLTESAALTNGQILIGSTGVAPVVANIAGTTNQVAVTNGAGSITLSTPQDIDTGADVEFASANLTGAIGLVVDNESQLGNVKVSGSIVDLTASGTIAIGGANSDVVNVGSAASVINIGNPTATVNIQGSINDIQTTNLVVTDALITINNGGPAASAANTGIEIEENAVITGYMKTSVDRNDLVFKAPAQAGVITMEGPTGAETVAYQSFVNDGLALKANIELDNLGTTAINAALIPDSDNSRMLGSWGPFRRWADILTSYIDTNSINFTDYATGQNYYSSISQNTGVYNLYIKSEGTGSPTDGTFLDSTLNTRINAGTTIDLLSGSNSNITILTSDNGGGDTGSINIATGTASANRGTVSLDAKTVSITADDAISLIPDSNSSVTLQTSGTGGVLIQSDSAIDIGPNAGLVAPTLKFWSGDWNNYTGLKAPDVGVGDLTYTLPAADGSSDQVLKTDGSGILSWRTVNDFSSTGSFAGADGQVLAADITGLVFGQTGKAIVEVVVDATSDLYEAFDVLVIKKAASYELTYSSVGDLSGVVLSITTGGQIQYTSDTYPGFVSLTIKSKKVQL